MLQKFPSDKIKVRKKYTLFSFTSSNSSKFYFYFAITRFPFHFIFIKVYNFVQQKAWTLLF